jgi:hypothetical protein
MPLRRRPFDLALVCCFALFAFTSLVMEPYAVFSIDLHRAGDPFAAGWLLYASRWDPVFLDPPLFMKIICAFDLFLYGPFYLVLIYAFVKRRDWIRIPALLYVTAICFSTGEYFIWEFISERGRADMTMVVLVNVPYMIVPLLLAWRVRAVEVFDDHVRKWRDTSEAAR